MPTSEQFQPIIVTGDGQTSVIPLPVVFSSEAVITVLRVDVSANPVLPGTSAFLRLGVDYTLTGNGLDGMAQIVLTAPLEAGATLVIDRKEPGLVGPDFRDQMNFPGVSVGQVLDQLARAIQDAGRLAGRAILLSPVDAEHMAVLPALDENEVVVSFSLGDAGISTRAFPAVVLDQINTRLPEITSLASNEMLAALRDLGNPTRQQQIISLFNRRDAIDTLFSLNNQIDRLGGLQGFEVLSRVGTQDFVDNVTIVAGLDGEIARLSDISNHVVLLGDPSIASAMTALVQGPARNTLDALGVNIEAVINAGENIAEFVAINQCKDELLDARDDLQLARDDIEAVLDDDRFAFLMKANGFLAVQGHAGEDDFVFYRQTGGHEISGLARSTITHYRQGIAA